MSRSAPAERVKRSAGNPLSRVPASALDARRRRALDVSPNGRPVLASAYPNGIRGREQRTNGGRKVQSNSTIPAWVWLVELTNMRLIVAASVRTPHESTTGSVG